MDVQNLDQMQYLYNNKQLSQEEYMQHKRKASVKRLMLATALIDSCLGHKYFDQMWEEFNHDETKIL